MLNDSNESNGGCVDGRPPLEACTEAEFEAHLAQFLEYNQCRPDLATAVLNRRITWCGAGLARCGADCRLQGCACVH
jgi:hypothetical protein